MAAERAEVSESLSDGQAEVVRDEVQPVPADRRGPIIDG
jgi:hypothetical protein